MTLAEMQFVPPDLRLASAEIFMLAMTCVIMIVDLFIKDKKLYYVYNFLGIKPEQTFVSPELKPGKYTLVARNCASSSSGVPGRT